MSDPFFRLMCVKLNDLMQAIESAQAEILALHRGQEMAGETFLCKTYTKLRYLQEIGKLASGLVSVSPAAISTQTLAASWFILRHGWADICVGGDLDYSKINGLKLNLQDLARTVQ